MNSYLKFSAIALLALATSCSGNKTETKDENIAKVEEEQIAPVVVLETQKLIAEFPDKYYLLQEESVVDEFEKFYEYLLKVDRKTAKIDTLYDVTHYSASIDAVMLPDSSAIIITEHPQIGGFGAIRYTLENDSIIELIPVGSEDVTGGLNIETGQIILKEKALILYGGGEMGKYNEYADVENIYDLDGDLVKKGSVPSPKLNKGSYYFSGSAELMGMSGQVELNFDVNTDGKITGTGYIWSGKPCELKGMVHGRSVEIKAYNAGRLHAKMDLSPSVNSHGNSLNGTMMDDDYTFKVKTTGKKQR